MPLPLFLFFRQIDLEGFYSKEEVAILVKVERFLATCDDITTMAADRVLTSDPTTSATKVKLLAGGSLTRDRALQTKSSRVALLAGKDCKLAVDYFRALTKPPKQGPAKCFFPRHSMFARKGADWLDIQICYECVTMSITSKSGKIKLYTGINRNSRDLADTFFGYKSKNSKA